MMTPDEPLAKIAYACGCWMICGNYDLLVALASLPEAAWREYSRRRTEPDLLRRLAAGAIHPSGSDPEPAEPLQIDIHTAAGKLGSLMARDDFTVIYRFARTASLADRRRLADALQNDPQVRTEFEQAFHDARVTAHLIRTKRTAANRAKARAQTDRSDSECLFPARRGVILHACWRGGQHA